MALGNAKRARKRTPKIRVGKLEAAVRQLDTAIEFWFSEGDIVSVHTLASAAHEVIHSLHQNRYPPGLSPDLLLDSLVIRDQGSRDWVRLLRAPQNFFKHADKDPDPAGSIEFSPRTSELFILTGIRGLGNLGVALSTPQSAFLAWFALNRPSYLTPKGRKTYLSGVTEAKRAQIVSLPRPDFLRVFRLARERMKLSCERCPGVGHGGLSR